jgi:single stranded DNA-binding protein
MSASVILVGRIGRVGELKTAAESNTNYLGFTCATSVWVPSKTPGTEGTERPTWWHVRIFGRQAESLVQRLHVGDLVEVRGEAESSEWTGNDGAKRSSLEVKADCVRRLSSPQSTTRSTTIKAPAAATSDPGAYVPPAPAASTEEPPF